MSRATGCQTPMIPAIPEEYLDMATTTRRFLDSEVKPHEKQVDDADHADEALMGKLRRRAADLGIYGFNIPEELGGAGLTPTGDVVISAEMGRTSVAMAEVVGRLPQAIAQARPDQSDWFIRPVVAGEALVSNALTEPDAGSDLGALTTRAERAGDSWRINGFKHFICGAERSDFILALAVTEPQAPLRERFTVFILEAGTDGLEMVTRFEKMGWRGLPMNAFSMDNCLVPESHVLGEVGAGFSVIMASVNRMRLSIAARCVGTTGLLLEMATQYALERRTFGQRLADHQAIQFKIADMSTRYEAARLLTYAGAAQLEADHPSARVSASRAKVFSTETASWVADETMQIFGGAGYMREYPIERMFRDLRGYRIGEGASEIQRIQIARQVLTGGRT